MMGWYVAGVLWAVGFIHEIWMSGWDEDEGWFSVGTVYVFVEAAFWPAPSLYRVFVWGNDE
jgi:hypothetical protein